MRPTRSFRTASRKNYDVFCSKYVSAKISYETYKKILYTYNNNLAKYMLETGNEVKLPFGLGKLVIAKYKPKRIKIDKDGNEKINLPIDWKASKEHGKIVYHMNFHTEGYKYYWKWNYRTSRIKFSLIWKLEMARVHSRMLSTYIRKPNTVYKDLYKQSNRNI